MKKKVLAVILTVAMVAGLLPVIVFAEAPITVTSVDIGSPAPINVAYTEREIYQAIGNDYYLADKEAGYKVDPDNSSLRYYVEATGNWPAATGYDAMSAEKLYGVDLTIDLKSGYDWPEAIKSNDTPDFTGFTVNVCGTPVDLSSENVKYFYNDYWNTIEFCVLIGTASEDPIVKNVEVTPDCKSVEKGTSFTFEGAVLGTAENTFEWSVIGATSEATVIDSSGKLTVGDDEAAATVTVRATSTVDNTKYDESIVTVLDEEPTMTLEWLGSFNMYTGEVRSFTAVASGTETDLTVEWTLQGNTSANTKITASGYQNKNAYLEIGDDETSDTIIVIVTPVHYPLLFKTATITVCQSEKVSDIYIDIDLDACMLDPSKTEGEMIDIIGENVSLGDTETTSLGSDISLKYWNGHVWNGIGNGSNPVDLNKKYGVGIEVYPEDGCDWTDAVKEGDYSGLSFYLNGEKFEGAEYFFNSYWNCVQVTFIPTLVDAEFVGASLNLGEDLSLDFYAKVYNDAKIDDMYLGMRFTFNGNTYISVEHYTNENGECVFRFPGIAPHQMTDAIDAELVVLDETFENVVKVIDVKTGYTVEEYLGNLLEETDDGYLRTLLCDIVAYGRAAQYYMDYAEDGAVGDSIGTYWQYYVSTVLPEDSDALVITGNESETCKFTAVGVRYDSRNSVYVKIYSEDDFEANVFIYGCPYVWAYPENACVEIEENVYKLKLEPMTVLELDNVFEIVLNDGVNDVATIEYGVYAYVKAVYDDESAPETQKDLALALYRYSKSARAYDDSLYA